MITVQVISIAGLQFNCMISMIAIISSIIFVKRHTQSCYSILVKFTKLLICRSIILGNLCKNEPQISGIS